MLGAIGILDECSLTRNDRTSLTRCESHIFSRNLTLKDITDQPTFGTSADGHIRRSDQYLARDIVDIAVVEQFDQGMWLMRWPTARRLFRNDWLTVHSTFR